MSNNSWMAQKPCNKPGPEPCPEPEPCPKPCPKKETCCCNKDMKEALKLLFDPSIKDAVIQDHFAFVGKKYIVGAPLELAANYSFPGCDNLGLLRAKLCSIDPCQSDFIKIYADGFFYPVPTPQDTDPNCYFVPLPVEKVSLCDLDAVAFDYYPDAVYDFEGSLKALLDQKFPCHCDKDDDCCCGKGIFKDIFNPYSLSPQYFNITAGWLILCDAEVLGKIGNILVLKIAGRPTIFFVCLESVGLYGPCPVPSPQPEEPQ